MLKRLVESDRIQSVILYGPPGVGKTTLAHIIASTTSSRFVKLSGVESNVAEMRQALSDAIHHLRHQGKQTILFIDEIHRFNKSQQDVLLPDIEAGHIRFIGATTHNPFFFVNAPLVSRSQIFELFPLSQESIVQILNRAVADRVNGLGYLKINIHADALDHLAQTSDGDARRAMNALEIAALSTLPGPDGFRHISLQVAEESIQKKAIVYDADGDNHYDTISAYIKSMRGGDVDAALYWLAKMIVAGEDPRFITRRMLICAAEDVGLADPMALVLAQAAHHTAEIIGWPEARIPIAEATIYITAAPKSNSAMVAIDEAIHHVRHNASQPVPTHLKDGHYKGATQLGHGAGYLYPHNYPNHFVPQDYLGLNIQFYKPGSEGKEPKHAERLNAWRQQIISLRAKK
ncbi:MAG: replication-associated recombination protein A [Verrucomicrobia bacterium]|nr:replication-associated recombination protein A [Verrucomicrobiota bacterium]